MASFTNDDLLNLDREFAEQNIPLHARPFQAAVRILGPSFSIGPFRTSDGLEEITTAYRALFPGSDFWPGAGQGLAASVDRVHLITMPVVSGPRTVDLHTGLGFADASEWRAWCRNDPEIASKSAYAFADLHDLSYGLDSLPQNSEQHTYFHRSMQHLGDLSASLSNTGGTSDAALQNILLIAELALKGSLLQLGVPAKVLKDKFGHRLPELARELAKVRPHHEDEELQRVCEKMPNLVASRYGSSGLSRMQIVELAVASQFIAASAMRRISGADLALEVRRDGPRPSFHI
ncbi:hypothetical protein AB8E26_14990 [Stenotrophomonas rhizophila]|uniref:hypothetical protein n=1 Tax=Stenotrophomonas rhizophila TaxID=216778 RepID=UPI003518277F